MVISSTLVYIGYSQTRREYIANVNDFWANDF
jgi:hypothetical protein